MIAMFLDVGQTLLMGVFFCALLIGGGYVSVGLIRKIGFLRRFNAWLWKE